MHLVQIFSQFCCVTNSRTRGPVVKAPEMNTCRNVCCCCCRKRSMLRSRVKIILLHRTFPSIHGFKAKGELKYETEAYIARKSNKIEFSQSKWANCCL